MRVEAGTLVEKACEELGVSLSDLIALASVWVSPEIYRILQPVGGTWYPDRRRANLGLRVNGAAVEAVGQVIDGITLDNNTYANVAFKRALGVDRHDFTGFHICHIWPGTAYDAGCYTNLANLVAIPAELSSLTDHHPHIVACLKFRSWELYHWKPVKELAPVPPENYPQRWREPWPVNGDAVRAARKRAGVREPRLPIAERESTALKAPRIRSAIENTEAAMVAAFYLSKFDHERLQIGNQGETIDHLAAKLGVKRHTLKNYRDYFDSHTGSSRQGWKVPLPPGLQAVFNQLRGVGETELRGKVLDLLQR